MSTSICEQHTPAGTTPSVVARPRSSAVASFADHTAPALTGVGRVRAEGTALVGAVFVDRSAPVMATFDATGLRNDLPTAGDLTTNSIVPVLGSPPRRTG